MVQAIIKAKGGRASSSLINYIVRFGKLMQQPVAGQTVNRTYGVDCSADYQIAKQAFKRNLARRRTMGLKDPNKTAYHFVQSFDPLTFDQTKLQDYQQVYEMGAELADKWSEQHPGFPIFMATHTDAKGQHLHNHFVIGKVNSFTGKILNMRNPDLEDLKDLNDEVLRLHGFEQTMTPYKAQKRGKEEVGMTPRDYLRQQIETSAKQAHEEYDIQLELLPDFDKKQKHHRIFKQTRDAKAFSEVLKMNNIKMYRWRKNRIGYQIINKEVARKAGVEFTSIDLNGNEIQRSDHASARQLGGNYDAKHLIAVVNGDTTYELLFDEFLQARQKRKKKLSIRAKRLHLYRRKTYQVHDISKQVKKTSEKEKHALHKLLHEQPKVLSKQQLAIKKETSDPEKQKALQQHEKVEEDEQIDLSQQQQGPELS